jgi:hypothetical protein
MNNKLAIIKRIAAFAIACSTLYFYGVNQTAIAKSTPLVTATTSNTNSPSSTSFQKELLLAQARKNIDWGSFAWDFNISNVNIGTIRQKNMLGETEEFEAITFLIEAKSSIFIPIYFAYFYDSNGVQVGISPVAMEPNYGQWQAGNRANCYVVIPPNAANTVTIKMTRL